MKYLLLILPILWGCFLDSNTDDSNDINSKVEISNLNNKWIFMQQFANENNEHYESRINFLSNNKVHWEIDRYYIIENEKDYYFQRVYDSTKCTYTINDKYITIKLWHPRFEEWQFRYFRYSLSSNNLTLQQLDKYTGNTSNSIFGSFRDTSVSNTTYGGIPLQDTSIYVINFSEDLTFYEYELDKYFTKENNEIIWQPFEKKRESTSTYQIVSDSVVNIKIFKNDTNVTLSYLTFNNALYLGDTNTVTYTKE